MAGHAFIAKTRSLSTASANSAHHILDLENRELKFDYEQENQRKGIDLQMLDIAKTLKEKHKRTPTCDDRETHWVAILNKDDVIFQSWDTGDVVQHCDLQGNVIE